MTADAARVGRVFQAPRPSRPQNPGGGFEAPPLAPLRVRASLPRPALAYALAAACKLARERRQSGRPHGRKGRRPFAALSVFSAGAPGPLRSAPVRLFCPRARAPHPRPSPRLSLGHNVWVGRVPGKRRHRTGRRRPRTLPPAGAARRARTTVASDPRVLGSLFRLCSVIPRIRACAVGRHTPERPGALPALNTQTAIRRRVDERRRIEPPTVDRQAGL